MSRPIETRVHDLLTWLEKQRLAHADMVLDAGDASLWCKEEAERIAGHAQTVIDLNEMRKAGAAQERTIWTRAIETYFDATAVMDVEKYAEEIRKGIEGE